MSDPHVLGNFRMGYAAMGVTEPLFEHWKKHNKTSTISLRQRTVSASSDLYTMHPNITWTARSIDAVVKMGPAGRDDMDLGAVGMLDGVIKARSPFKMLDRFDYKGSRYEILSTPVEVRGRKGGFLVRKAAFKRVEFENI